MVGFDFETAAEKRGFAPVCGVDEAGRGPLAGPVFAAAVILPAGCMIEGLDDSKKLSEKRREALYPIICEKAVSFAVAQASHEEIDRLNILNATFLAMTRAVEALSVPPEYILVDGNRLPPQWAFPAEAIIKGDGISASIAAASVLAKVSRDHVMMEYDKLYPEYQFAKHKGYPTALHRELVRRYGPCEIHRRSFLKKVI